MSGRLSTRSVAPIGFVLATLVLCLGYVLYETGSSKAEAQNNANDCPNPHQVQEFGGAGEQLTPFFDIGTSRFRLLSKYLNVEPGQDLMIVNVVENERGESIYPETPAPRPGEPPPPNTREEIVNATPGRYRLSIQPQSQDREYDVTVQECGAPQPAPASPPNPGTLMSAGGPMSGPVPPMLDGSCPKEFPALRNGACYSSEIPL
jgi:hypothetical protein